MITVKSDYKSDKRLFSIRSNLTFQQLCEQLSLTYQIPVSSFSVKYQDQEGDLVTISSTEELIEAVANHVGHPPRLRLFVADSKNLNSDRKSSVAGTTPSSPRIIVDRHPHSLTFNEFDDRKLCVDCLQPTFVCFSCPNCSFYMCLSCSLSAVTRLARRLIPSSIDTSVTIPSSASSAPSSTTTTTTTTLSPSALNIHVASPVVAVDSEPRSVVKIQGRPTLVEAPHHDAERPILIGGKPFVPDPLAPPYIPPFDPKSHQSAPKAAQPLPLQRRERLLQLQAIADEILKISEQHSIAIRERTLLDNVETMKVLKALGDSVPPLTSNASLSARQDRDSSTHHQLINDISLSTSSISSDVASMNASHLGEILKEIEDARSSILTLLSPLYQQISAESSVSTATGEVKRLTNPLVKDLHERTGEARDQVNSSTNSARAEVGYVQKKEVAPLMAKLAQEIVELSKQM